MSNELNKTLDRINEWTEEHKAKHLSKLIKDAEFDVNFYKDKLDAAKIKLSALVDALHNLNVKDESDKG